MTTTENTDGDTESRDHEFGGLLAASGVPVSDAETAELRRAFDTLCNLAARCGHRAGLDRQADAVLRRDAATARPI